MAASKYTIKGLIGITMVRTLHVNTPWILRKKILLSKWSKDDMSLEIDLSEYMENFHILAFHKFCKSLVHLDTMDLFDMMQSDEINKQYDNFLT